MKKFIGIEENEPLLDGSQYQKTKIRPSKRIEKRTSSSSSINNNNNYEEFCFKEFSNNTSIPLEESQIEIRRQVYFLKELKNSDHIIRFFGVAQQDCKFYLITEWMENGNLYEYYTKFSYNINWETKINFALDICRGIAYLHRCKILHHNVQSANVLVNGNNKIRIANFGLSRKFSEITRNISHNLENVRYMAPEKLLTEDNGIRKKKVPYDTKCEIYSVGALLWEIAELKKPHSDLNKSEILLSIRTRVRERYRLPFSDDVPYEWIFIVSKAMEYEPEYRISISDICRDFYKLSKKFSYAKSISLSYIDPNSGILQYNNTKISTLNDYYRYNKILSVDDAIREHKSKHGNKQLAWQSFKYHSINDNLAKYMVGYYYYHDDEILELQQINKDERIRIAVKIFEETADKGNPSAQLRFGICLWKGEGVKANSIEALRYLKMAANSGNSAAMYIIGKAYWNGGNGIEQDKIQGAEYLKNAALNNHPTAKVMCNSHNII
ncbi:kinase-like domain-containing protein [Glomus cerebriforme]|uniref:Kinase-like domain-containing protein n=1 Tax=Glomus cerebriforme TaxID=658196 RepID=A0A397SB19_9GLOM|nr:kinase-like domain-containing protein [Glomus cerebriforme]